jgi:hypothetical protein
MSDRLPEDSARESASTGRDGVDTLFDELAKALAVGVSRREALRRYLSERHEQH